MTNLNTLIETAGQHAQMVMVGLNMDLMPSWLLFDKEGHCDIVGTPWRNEEEKQFVVRKMRQYMRQKATVCYSVVVEAWAAKAPEGWNQEEELQPWEKPMERHDRWELVVAIASNGTEMQAKQWQIVRDPFTQKVTALVPEDMTGSVEGVLANMLS
jgi:hypothetical protein